MTLPLGSLINILNSVFFQTCVPDHPSYSCSSTAFTIATHWELATSIFIPLQTSLNLAVILILLRNSQIISLFQFKTLQWLSINVLAGASWALCDLDPVITLIFDFSVQPFVFLILTQTCQTWPYFRAFAQAMSSTWNLSETHTSTVGLLNCPSSEYSFPGFLLVWLPHCIQIFAQMRPNKT